MNNLRWILLGVAVVIIVAVYLFGRARKKDQSYASICAASEIPTFSVEEEKEEIVDENGWADGVGPVRVVSSYKTDAEIIDDAIDDIEENIEDGNTEKMYTDDIDEPEPELDEVIVDNGTQDISEVIQESIEEVAEEENITSEQFDEPESEIDNQLVNAAENAPVVPADIAIDDVISIYVLAKKDCSIKGNDILKACRGLNLEYGDMKIFHRHAQTEADNILFSMASIQEPGWFEIEDMDQMETLGISFFMQANLVDNPSDVLDDMLICAHGFTTKLDAKLCNSHRKTLDEEFTKELRAKIKQLEVLKSTSIH